MTFIINNLYKSCHGWLKLDEIHVVYWNKVWHVSHPNNSMLSRMIGIWMGNHLVSDKNCNIVIYNVHFIDLLRYDFTKNVMNTTNIVQIYVQIFRCWFVFVDYIEIIVLLPHDGLKCWTCGAYDLPKFHQNWSTPCPHSAPPSTVITYIKNLVNYIAHTYPIFFSYAMKVSLNVR